MKPKLLFVLVPALMLTACGGVDLTSSSSKKEEPSLATTSEIKSQPSSETVSSEEASSVNPLEGQKLVINYQNDGGANIPTSWNDDDKADTARKATYTVAGVEFSIEFVGKWRNSSNKEEFQTQKNPVSYVRAASDIVVKKVEIETFQADMEVYKTRDHTGDKVTGQEISGAVHGDGDLMTYDLNTADWSILAKETYKGSNINIYAFNFYF